MSEQGNDTPKAGIGGAFQSAATFVRENKLETGALLTALLLGSTSLASPALTTALGATAALGGSIALLLSTGKTTIQNTLALGEKFGMSTMTLGLIIGSLNTIPEVMVSLGSAFRGAIELGVGNVVGSNIAHTMLILGATAAIDGIAKAKDMSWKFNTAVMAGTSALFGAQLVLGTFSPIAGGLMVAGGAAYLVNRIRSIKKEQAHNHEHDHDHSHDHDHHHHDHDHAHGEDGEVGTCLFHDHDDDEEELKAKKRPRWLNTVLAGSGMLGLIAAADLIVQSGVSVADKFNLSAMGMNFGITEAAVGAVIVAIGTALPELTLSIQAIRKKHSDLAIGNILGCSIINTLIAGGVISMTGAPVPEAFNPSTTMGMVNIGVFMGSAGLLAGTLIATKGALKRWMGGVALAGYAAYIGSALVLGDGDAPVHKHSEIEPVVETIETAEHMQPERMPVLQI